MPIVSTGMGEIMDGMGKRRFSPRRIVRAAARPAARIAKKAVKAQVSVAKKAVKVSAGVAKTAVKTAVANKGLLAAYAGGPFAALAMQALKSGGREAVEQYNAPEQAIPQEMPGQSQEARESASEGKPFFGPVASAVSNFFDSGEVETDEQGQVVKDETGKPKKKKSIVKLAGVGLAGLAVLFLGFKAFKRK